MGGTTETGGGRPAGSADDLLRQHLLDLGGSAAAVRALLRSRGFAAPDACANVRAHLEAAGWRDVVIEPLGDTGWLYARAVAPAGEEAAVDLPEAVVGYVNMAERSGEGGR
jgi:hypothetical protein